VGPEAVVQPCDGRLVAEGAVSAAMVVMPEPSVKGADAFGVGAVDRAVGPAAQQGADEAFGLAVGLWSVGASAQVAQSEGAAGDRYTGTRSPSCERVPWSRPCLSG
jgi:hypothetical protein